VFDLEKKWDDHFTPALHYRSVGIGKRNQNDIIKQQAYNITNTLFREDDKDVSYSIARGAPLP
jgi:hypothetical protein